MRPAIRKRRFGLEKSTEEKVEKMVWFLVSITVFPVSMGLTLMRLKKEKETVTLKQCYLAGLLCLSLLGEIVSCAAIQLERGFSFYCGLLGAAVVSCSVLSVLLHHKLARRLLGNCKYMFTRIPETCKKRRRRYVEWGILLVLCIILAAGYFLYVPDTGNDTMAETISVTVMTDTVFQYNPVTGQILRYGMYPVYKFTSLPLMYSALYRLCGMPLSFFLYCAVPLWMLCVSFAVFSEWGRALFGAQKEKRQLFLIFLFLLIMMGDGEKTSYAYHLLHGAWKGSTLAAVLVIPFGVYIAYEMFTGREWLYGGVGILLALSGLLFARPLFPPSCFVFGAADSGKQWGTLLLAVLALYLAREKTKKRWKKSEVYLLAFCLLSGLVSGGAFSLLGTAYAAVCLWSIAEEWQRGAVVFASLLLFICMAGTVLPFRAQTPKKWHISPADEEIQDKITALAENYEGDVMLVGPASVMEEARIRSGKIILPYGKDLWYTDCNREIADIYTEKELMLFEQMKIDYKQPDTVAAMAAGLECNLLVIRETLSREAMDQYGWQEAGRTEGYAVYCR